MDPVLRVSERESPHGRRTRDEQHPIDQWCSRGAQLASESSGRDRAEGGSLGMALGLRIRVRKSMEAGNSFRFNSFRD